MSRQILAGIAQMAMLKRVPAVQSADTAAFLFRARLRGRLASDRAGALTSGIAMATCGLVAG